MTSVPATLNWYEFPLFDPVHAGEQTVAVIGFGEAVAVTLAWVGVGTAGVLVPLHATAESSNPMAKTLTISRVGMVASFCCERLSRRRDLVADLQVSSHRILSMGIASRD